MAKWISKGYGSDVFTVKVDTANAAFEENRYRGELVRLLRQVANGVEQGMDAGILKDVNGNSVGRFGFAEGGVDG